MVECGWDDMLAHDFRQPLSPFSTVCVCVRVRVCVRREHVGETNNVEMYATISDLPFVCFFCVLLTFFCLFFIAAANTIFFNGLRVKVFRLPVLCMDACGVIQGPS